MHTIRNEQHLAALVTLAKYHSIDSMRLFGNISIFFDYADMRIPLKTFWQNLDSLTIYGYAEISGYVMEKYPVFQITPAGKDYLAEERQRRTWDWHYAAWSIMAPTEAEFKRLKKSLTPAQKRLILGTGSDEECKINNVLTRNKLRELGLMQNDLLPDFHIMKLTRRGVIFAEMLEKGGYWTNKSALMYFHDYRMIRIGTGEE